VYKPKKGTRAVNLSPFIPESWEYVEVHLNEKKKSYIILTLTEIKVDNVVGVVPRQVQNAVE
jgi:hypothetical protein